ncbi:MAG: CtpF protein [Pseudomonadota bacterium]
MTKAVEPAFEFDDNEEGAAKSAASLGPDGGPLVAATVSYDDDSWLDEDLSDEELAALGEDDFDDEELISELDLIKEKNPSIDDDDLASLLEEEEISSDDFSLDDEFLDEISDESLPVEAPVAEDTAEPLSDENIAASSAVVAAGSVLPTDLSADEEFDTEVSTYGDEEVDHRPVPRISIHAFCETPAITALLEKAAVDRRLSKTHLTMHMGGLAKAIDHFQGASTPNLILIEALDGGAELFGQLGELAEVCDPSTKVIIIGRVNDIGLYRELMSQGVSDYIVRPKSPLHVIKSIAELYVDPSAPPIGKTIAFVGARGGVGSSTIAHNVGWSIAEEFHSDTVILDLDLPFGTASLDFEQDPTSGLVEALSSPERLDDVLLDRLLQKHTDRLSLFTAPNLLDRDYDLDDQAFETVIDVVRGAAPTIVIDVPHVWTGWSKRLLQTADEIVITAAPDLASFRNTKNLVDVISSARPNDASPTLVINQFDPKVSSVQAEQFVEHVGITPAVIFPWEPQLFHAAATNAAPIMEVGAKTKTAQGLRDLAARVIGRDQSLTKSSKFSLSGLFKK